MRLTKIVNTIGPSSNSPEKLRELLKAGTDIFRLNMSHGSPAEKAALVKTIRELAKEENRVVAVLADLQGPKIRLACFKNRDDANDKSGFAIIKAGDKFTLDAELGWMDGDETIVGIDYKGLPQDVRPGDTLLINDGVIVLTVDNVEGAKIHCTVSVGGKVSDHKGINRLGGGLSAEALTAKDKEDLKVMAAADVDFFGISFIRSANEVEEARRLITEAGGKARIISKIERAEAIHPEVLRKIILASDAIMVARGDLGVEIGLTKVPAAQKLMLEMARACNRPAITATQMLESMIHESIPTRAEVSDLTNAILDGTDAIMTSAETAAGAHPVEVVTFMNNACETVEEAIRDGDYDYNSGAPNYDGEYEMGDNNGEKYFMAQAIADNAIDLAYQTGAVAVVTCTHNGDLVSRLTRRNGLLPILAATDCCRTHHAMALYRNVIPYLVTDDPEKIAKEAQTIPMGDAKCPCQALIRELNRTGVLQNGDRVVVVTKSCCGSAEGKACDVSGTKLRETELVDMIKLVEIK